MVIVFGLIAAGLALYIWLKGHQFGRILAFTAFFGLTQALMTPYSLEHPSAGVGAVLLLLSIGISWFLASAPKAWAKMRMEARADEISRVRAMVVRQ